MYTRMMALKQKNPKLKITLAVGGWNVGPGKFKQQYLLVTFRIK